MTAAAPVARRFAAVPAPAGDPAYTALPTSRERAFAREALLSLLPALLGAALLALAVGGERARASFEFEHFRTSLAPQLANVSATLDGTKLGPRALSWRDSDESIGQYTLRVPAGDPARPHVLRFDWEEPEVIHGKRARAHFRDIFIYDPAQRKWDPFRIREDSRVDGVYWNPRVRERSRGNSSYRMTTDTVFWPTHIDRELVGTSANGTVERWSSRWQEHEIVTTRPDGSVERTRRD